MKDNLKQLEPNRLWNYFSEILKIPRTSKNEQQIGDYLANYAAKNGLEVKRDKTGNLLITRPASPGMEHKRTIVLQSHLDMVGEKSPNSDHNWLTDPIIPVIDGEWVRAKETTLGADDGIGVAAQMAVLTDESLKCGKIEALFTVDEETGLTGAMNLKADFFTGRTLLNLDSEDEGIMFIGCAGGIDTIGKIHYNPQKPEKGEIAAEIAITGLHGGHSGDEIHKGYANAIKLMAECIKMLTDRYEISIAQFQGGNLRNAIPREAKATITFKKEIFSEIQKSVLEYTKTVTSQFKESEENISISLRESPTPSFVVEKEGMGLLINALIGMPNGVLGWSASMPGLVETSSNLAIINFIGDNTINIATSQRSSVGSERDAAAKAVEQCLRSAGAEVIHSEGYPGWEPNMDSEILDITLKSYKKLFGKEPVVTAIHAGLECGLFYEKIGGMDMISFGPTVKGAHTTEERLEIKTVKMFWDLLIDILKEFK